MDPLDLFLRVGLLPAAVCAVLALAARAARRAPRLRDAAVALALAAGFCAALYATGSRPSLPLAPSDDAWKWVFWLAPAGAALGIAGSFARAGRIEGLLLRWAAGAGASWLVLRALVPHAVAVPEALGRAAAGGLVAAGVWTALLIAAGRSGRPALVGLGPLLVAVLGTASVLLRNGSSVTMTEAAGALAACVGSTAALTWLRGGAPLPAAAAPAVALVFVGLLLGAHAYLNFGDVVGFPLPTALLLAAAAACVALPRPWLATGVALLLAVLASVVASRLGTTADSYM